jgi:hypothetical protein
MRTNRYPVSVRSIHLAYNARLATSANVYLMVHMTVYLTVHANMYGNVQTTVSMIAEAAVHLTVDTMIGHTHHSLSRYRSVHPRQ